MWVHPRNLQLLDISKKSTKQSGTSSSKISKNSSLLNPGVSATNPPNKSSNSECLVVCFPLPKAFDISLVSKLNNGFNAFNKLLPTICKINKGVSSERFR